MLIFASCIRRRMSKLISLLHPLVGDHVVDVADQVEFERPVAEFRE